MEHFLQTWGYLAIFGITLISAMCLPIGAEAAVAYGGALASGHFITSGHDHLNLILVIVVAVLGDLVGSYLGYAIGYLGGRPLVDRLGKYVLLTHKDLDRAEEWFARRGEPAVLFTRCIPLLRSFISLAAGLGEMTLGKFTVFTLIGCVVWNSVLATIGYNLGSSWHHVVTGFSYAGYVFGILAVLVVVGLILHRLRVVRAERAGVTLGRKGAHSRR